MTQEEAETQRDNLNTDLTTLGVLDQMYKVLENWSNNYQSNWDVCLIPDVNEVKFDAANAQQLAGFGRVYQLTIREVGVGDNYVAKFATNAELDPDLGPYLP
jgi:hypothetical protein